MNTIVFVNCPAVDLGVASMNESKHRYLSNASYFGGVILEVYCVITAVICNYILQCNYSSQKNYRM